MKTCAEHNSSSSYFVRPAVSVLQRDVGLLPDAVQVLVKAVQEKGQELV